MCMKCKYLENEKEIIRNILKYIFKYILYTDQPGRILAVFVIAPILFYKGWNYRDIFIICFAIVLFFGDLYWLVFKAPNSTLLTKSMKVA